jgi:hypothetical protein
MKLYRKKPILKSQLAELMQISYSTFVREFVKHESKILELFPEYKKHSRLLYPKVVDYLFEIYGLSWEELYIFEDKAKNREQKSTT